MITVIDLESCRLYPIKARDLLTLAKMTSSKSQADRLIKQKAVTIKLDREGDSEDIIDGLVHVLFNSPIFIRVGRKWIKVIIEAQMPPLYATIEDLTEDENA